MTITSSYYTVIPREQRIQLIALLETLLTGREPEVLQS